MCMFYTINHPCGHREEAWHYCKAAKKKKFLVLADSDQGCDGGWRSETPSPTSRSRARRRQQQFDGSVSTPPNPKALPSQPLKSLMRSPQTPLSASSPSTPELSPSGTETPPYPPLPATPYLSGRRSRSQSPLDSQSHDCHGSNSPGAETPTPDTQNEAKNQGKTKKQRTPLPTASPKPSLAAPLELPGAVMYSYVRGSRSRSRSPSSLPESQRGRSRHRQRSPLRNPARCDETETKEMGKQPPAASAARIRRLPDGKYTIEVITPSEEQPTGFPDSPPASSPPAQKLDPRSRADSPSDAEVPAPTTAPSSPARNRRSRSRSPSSFPPKNNHRRSRHRSRSPLRDTQRRVFHAKEPLGETGTNKSLPAFIPRLLQAIAAEKANVENIATAAAAAAAADDAQQEVDEPSHDEADLPQATNNANTTAKVRTPRRPPQTLPQAPKEPEPEVWTTVRRRVRCANSHERTSNDPKVICGLPGCRFEELQRLWTCCRCRMRLGRAGVRPNREAVCHGRWPSGKRCNHGVCEQCRGFVMPPVPVYNKQLGGWVA